MKSFLAQDLQPGMYVTSVGKVILDVRFREDGFVELHFNSEVIRENGKKPYRHFPVTTMRIWERVQVK